MPEWERRDLHPTTGVWSCAHLLFLIVSPTPMKKARPLAYPEESEVFFCTVTGIEPVPSDLALGEMAGPLPMTGDASLPTDRIKFNADRLA